MLQDPNFKKESKHFIIELIPKLTDLNGSYHSFLKSKKVEELIGGLANQLDEFMDKESNKAKQIGIKTYQNNIRAIKPPFVPEKKQEITIKVQKPKFKIMNFKINEERKNKIDIVEADNISIVDVKIQENLGLKFDKESSSIYGTPSMAGDFELHLQWSDENNSKSTDKFTLTVIDDPKNLWKNLDSDESDKYYKPDIDSKIITTDNYQIVAGSIRGRSHAHVGSFRDDDFYIHTDKENNWSILVVADGAGSAKCSRKGSQIACLESGECVKAKIIESYDEVAELIGEFDLSDEKTRQVKEKFYYILGDAFKSALSGINKESQISNIPIKDFSTTLLVAVIFQYKSKMFVASAMIGDGAIALYSDSNNNVYLLGNSDGGEFAGQTRFLDNGLLADGTFWDRIFVGLYEEPTALFLMTDGISDPKFETDNGLKNHSLWSDLWQEIQPIVFSEGTDIESSLLNWMSFFSPGHHDDRTIAVYSVK